MIWVTFLGKGDLRQLQKCDSKALLQSADRPLLMEDFKQYEQVIFC